jgi:hypothetical protein
VSLQKSGVEVQVLLSRMAEPVLARFVTVLHMEYTFAHLVCTHCAYSNLDAHGVFTLYTTANTAHCYSPTWKGG